MTWESIFRREPAPLLGLDVSAFSVKLVEFSRRRSGRLVLEHCAMQALEPGWITNGHIEAFDEVVDAIRKVQQKSGSKTSDAAMALPASAVITKTLVLPAGLSSKALQIHVENEASQYIPFPLDEVCLDFREIGPSVQSPGEVQVLMAASRKEMVSDRQGLAEAAGLRAIVVDVASLACRRAAGRTVERLGDGESEPLVALFEVGAQFTSLQILHNDDVLFESQQPLAGAQLTQMIGHAFGLSPEESESRKRSADLPPEYPTLVLLPFVESLAQEMNRALALFFTSTPFNRVDHVLLAGGSAVLPGLDDAVTRHTGTACKVLNPFDDVELGPGLAIHRTVQEAPAYLTATGLALRRFCG